MLPIFFLSNGSWPVASTYVTFCTIIAQIFSIHPHRCVCHMTKLLDTSNFFIIPTLIAWCQKWIILCSKFQVSYFHHHNKSKQSLPAIIRHKISNFPLCFLISSMKSVIDRYNKSKEDNQLAMTTTSEIKVPS